MWVTCEKWGQKSGKKVTKRGEISDKNGKNKRQKGDKYVRNWGQISDKKGTNK